MSLLVCRQGKFPVSCQIAGKTQLAGQKERIDHRSHAERGLLERPTVHEGVVARAMENLRSENRAQQVYGEKYSPLLMFDSKKAVSRMLHEDMERQAVRKLIRQAQKDQRTFQKKKSEQER